MAKFLPGQSGNPKGRPKGSRDKLCEDFLRDLTSHWKVAGKTALKAAAIENPAAYCLMVSKLLPKDINLGLSESLADALERVATRRLADLSLAAEPPRLRN